MDKVEDVGDEITEAAEVAIDEATEPVVGRENKLVRVIKGDVSDPAVNDGCALEELE